MEPVVQKEILLLQRTRCTFPAFLICIEKFGLSKEKSKYTSASGGHRQSQPFPVRDQNPVSACCGFFPPRMSMRTVCLSHYDRSHFCCCKTNSSHHLSSRLLLPLFSFFSFFNLPLRNIVHLTSTHYYPPAVCCCLCWRGCLKK